LFLGHYVEAGGDKIVGFTMIGPEAGEVMAAVQIAMLGGPPYTVFGDAILAHPTMAEGLNELFSHLQASSAG
jgi:pyruvate/2-oxoglutarate dehydrogenase complex dihydrolipoamide dehydrogenase (E3) component